MAESTEIRVKVEKNITVLATENWEDLVADARSEGEAWLEEHREPLFVDVLGPDRVKAGAQCKLSAVTLEPSWRTKRQLELVDAARKLVTELLVLGLDADGATTVLSKIIEGHKIETPSDDGGEQGLPLDTPR